MQTMPRLVETRRRLGYNEDINIKTQLWAGENMKNDLNVCLMNDSFPPVIDGVANAVVNYAGVINKSFGEATVVTPQYPNAVDDYPFDVVRYPSIKTEQLVGYRTGVPFDVKTFGALEKKGFNIIHSHCPVVSTLLARTMREELNVPVVFTYHTKFDINIADMVKSRLLQDAMLKNLCGNIQACDEVWVVSRGAGENLKKIGYEGDYVVMENGVDFPKGRVDAAAAELREHYGIAQDETVFIYVGRMMWYKGIRITLDGLKAAFESGKRFRMVFVGDGAERGEMEEYARSLGLEERCIFAGAVHDREKLRAYFCMADLFLFPSTFDTNGIVVREAAACGLASVLVRGSCAAEGAMDGQNAYFIDENSEAMAKVVKWACENRTALRTAGEHAMNELYISWEQSIARAVERYGVVIENYHSGGTCRDALWTDPFFAMAADVAAKLSAARERRQQIEAKSHDIYAQAWQYLERYL